MLLSENSPGIKLKRTGNKMNQENNESLTEKDPNISENKNRNNHLLTLFWLALISPLWAFFLAYCYSREAISQSIWSLRGKHLLAMVILSLISLAIKFVIKKIHNRWAEGFSAMIPPEFSKNLPQKTSLARIIMLIAGCALGTVALFLPYKDWQFYILGNIYALPLIFSIIPSLIGFTITTLLVYQGLIVLNRDTTIAVLNFGVVLGVSHYLLYQCVINYTTIFPIFSSALDEVSIFFASLAAVNIIYGNPLKKIKQP